MTVITKSNVNKPTKINVDEKDSGACICDEKPGYVSNVDLEEDVLWTIPSKLIIASRRFAFFLCTVLFISSIILFLVVYQHAYSQSTKSQFRGWCGVPFSRNDLHLKPSSHHVPSVMAEHRKDILPGNMFKEEFDMDLSSQLYMKIYVPDFGYGISAQFLHDYGVNKTGIILHKEEKCFVMPLDRHHVKPPRDMFEVIRKMWLGTYDVDTRVIRRRMRIVYPELSDLSDQGRFIRTMCAHYNTYYLEEVDSKFIMSGRFKRSENDELNIAEFAGQNVVEYTIQQ